MNCYWLDWELAQNYPLDEAVARHLRTHFSPSRDQGWLGVALDAISLAAAGECDTKLPTLNGLAQPVREHVKQLRLRAFVDYVRSQQS